MAFGVELVIEELKTAGFSELEMPLRLAGFEFEFEAAVVGTGVSHDLVVIATEMTEYRRLVRLTEGLGRALDHLESRRPVTVVYIGADAPLDLLDQLERNVRVLLIPSNEPDEAEVRQGVSVLMPLRLPLHQGRDKEPIGEVMNALGDSTTDEHLDLILASRGGVNQVREALKQYLDDVFAGEMDGPGLS